MNYNKNGSVLLKAVGLIIGCLVLFYFGTIYVFNRAGSPAVARQNKIAQVTRSKTPITEIDKYYHLNRGINSDAISGRQAKKKYYFIYLPSKKRGYLYNQSQVITEPKIKQTFIKRHGHKRKLKINLGWYKGQAVWEVSYQNDRKNYGYALYSLKKGHEISYIDNL